MASSLKYIILEDSYFIAMDIRNTISAIRPHTECAAIVEGVEDCINMSDSQDVDLIIVDIESTGEYAINKFKQAGFMQPLILISSRKDIKVSGLNMIEIILKPVTASALTDAFRKYDELNLLSNRKLTPKFL